MVNQIADEDLRFLIAGALSYMTSLPAFPVMVKDIERIETPEGQAEGFTITTESGLAYSVRVSFEGQR